jgi:hypothetical protein
MDNKNNIFDDGIEIIDEFEPTPNTNDNRQQADTNNQNDLVMDDYMKEFAFEQPTNEVATDPLQSINMNQNDGVTNAEEPDLLSAFNIDFNSEDTNVPAAPGQALNVEPELETVELDVPITENNNVQGEQPVMNSEVTATPENTDRIIETLNTAGVDDSRSSMPVSEEKEEVLAIAQEEKKDIDNKKGIIFIAVLFILLIVFIIALPQITQIVKQITG